MTANAPSTLFDFFDRSPSYKLAARKFSDWLRRRKERFSFFIILSIAAHLTVCGFLVISRAAAKRTHEPAGQAEDFQAFREALRDLNASPEESGVLAKFLSSVTEEDVHEALAKAPRLDDRLTNEEKAKIFKAVVSEALARFREGKGSRSILDVSLGEILGDFQDLQGLESQESFVLYQFEDAAGGNLQLFRLSREKEQKLRSLKALGDQERGHWSVLSSRVYVQSEDGIFAIPQEYFFREPPYEEMLARGAKLFYIVRGFPVLEAIEKATNQQLLDVGRSDLQKIKPADEDRDQPGFLVAYIKRPEAGRVSTIEPAAAAAIPLTEGNINRILDGLMDLSEGEQLKAFNRDYLYEYEADSQDLAQLTKEFIYRNLGSVFILTDPLSVGFDFLEEIYYDTLSMDDFVAYWLNNKQTRTAAEILFCLAASYDFEKRAIVYLQESLEEAQNVLRGKDTHLDVFNKQAKAFVIQEIYQEFARELKGRGFSTLESILLRYTEEQAKIYRLLMDMGGDIRNRALYALGGLYWDECRADLALETWKEIDPSFSFGPLNEIRKIIASSENTVNLVSRISGVINQAEAANSREQLERLVKFHKWEKRSDRGH